MLAVSDQESDMRMETEVLSRSDRKRRNAEDDDEGQPIPFTMTIQTRRAARNQRSGQQMSALDEKEEQSKRELQVPF